MQSHTAARAARLRIAPFAIKWLAADHTRLPPMPSLSRTPFAPLGVFSVKLLALYRLPPLSTLITVIKRIQRKAVAARES
jgi:hypothetical protein